MTNRYLTQDMPAFFRELRENNHKEWFDDNKKWVFACLQEHTRPFWLKPS